MIKKLIQGAIGVGILVGLYIYGDSLPSSGPSKSATGYATADHAEHQVLVQRVSSQRGGDTIDVRVTAKVPLILVAIESQLGSIDSRRFRGHGPEIYIPEAGSSRQMKAGETVTYRATVPRNPESGGFGEFVRTKVRFNYAGDARPWDGENPRYRTVVDLK